MKQFIKEAQRLQKLAGITEAKDYFKGSYFGDEDGNDLYSVEKVYDFVKKNKTKYLKNNFPLDSIKHNLKWWGKHYDINNKDHKERMMNADTSYPLLVIKEKNGNLSVADGLNRLYKAIKIEKKENLPVYFISDKSDIKDLKKTTNTNEAKVIPSNYGQPLFADFSYDESKKDFLSKFARTLAELVYEEAVARENRDNSIKLSNLLNYEELADIQDGDDFYTSPDESSVIFKRLPKTFILKHNLDGDDNIESWEITKTDSDSFNAKIVTNTNEAKVVPQRMPRRLKGQISAEEWQSIGPNFTTDELIINYDTDESQTIFETPQGFRFDKTPYPIRNGEVLVYELQYNDYDPDPDYELIEEWADDQVNELKQQLKNAGYNLEVAPFNGGMMLYIPV
jgi:hypothetical protein